MAKYFRKLIHPLCCARMRAQRPNKKLSNWEEREKTWCFFFNTVFHCAHFSILCVYLFFVCMLRGHLLVRCKWDKQKEVTRKKSTHTHSGRGSGVQSTKRELNWFCATIKWKCFIYLVMLLPPSPSSPFHSPLPFHYDYYLCLFLFLSRRTERCRNEIRFFN